MKEGLTYGLSLTSRGNTDEDLCFPSEALMDFWIIKLEQFCRFHSFNEGFRLLYKLGSGSFGTVFAALEYKSESIYAVKIVPKSQQDLISREAEILKDVKVANVPKVLKVLEDQYKMYLVMQLVPGVDIRNYLNRFGPLSESLARKVVFSLAWSLSLIHIEGIIHRDIKPENVLIDIRHGREVSSVSLVDFGLAIRRDQARAGSCCGTAGYLAPELLRFQEFDCKVDVFSLGVLTYTLIAGECPFASSTVQRIKYLNLKCKLDFSGGKWQHVSKACQAFITSLTCLEPAQRPTTHQALSLPWLGRLKQQYDRLSLAKVTREDTTDSIGSTQPD